jgi:hypothetical protein
MFDKIQTDTYRLVLIVHSVERYHLIHLNWYMISATLSINSVLNQFHEHLELHVKRAIALIFYRRGSGINY